MAGTSNDAPETLLVILGSLQFEPSGESDVLSVKIATPDEMEATLEAAKGMLQPNQLQNLHVILTASSVPLLFNDSIVTTFSDELKTQAEVTFHIMANNPEMPVQAADANEIRVAIVTSGLSLEMEASSGDDGGWLIQARKQ